MIESKRQGSPHSFALGGSQRLDGAAQPTSHLPVMAASVSSEAEALEVREGMTRRVTCL